ncbi:MAG: hypothetical protein LHW57_07750 [Candidatus Cloacimonetes bacterium]|nr:hypothetical protein [Candidatus Cloacimonadota bacterium]
MINKHILIILAMLFVLAGLSAWSITDSYFGNRYGVLDARSQAMGGTGLFDDMRPAGIIANPANLTLMDKGAGLEGAVFVNRNEDNRAVPLYNSFDNYIDDAIYASNINFYDDYSGAAFTALQLGWARFGVGAYYKPRLSFDGNYQEQIRNNRNTDNDGYPEMVAVNTIATEGRLDQASAVASMGFRLGDVFDVNLGLDYGLLFGDTASSTTIRWSQWAIDTVGEGVLPDYTYTEHTDLAGHRLKGGLGIRINENFGLGSTYALKSVLDRQLDYSIQQDAWLGHAAMDSTASFSEDYILPTQISLGLNYQPRNIMRTWFNFEVEMVRFSEISTHYQDCLNFAAGVEHHIQNRLPLRLGFSSENSYLRVVEPDGAVIAKKIITPTITGGSSVFLADNLHLDLGIGYSWREYEALDLFGDSYYNDKLYTGSSTYQLWPNQYIVLTDRGWENPDKVRESNVSLSASLSVSW